MNTERLTEILDAYGADPARWPEAERGAAIALLARSPEMEAHRAAAERLDAVLDTAAVVGDLGLDSAKVAANITGRGGVVPMRRRRAAFAGAWPGLAGLAAAAAAGLLIGWLGVGGEYLGFDNGAAAAEQSAGPADGFVPEESQPW